MANSIKIKRSAVAAKVPLTTDIELGELAINTYDGKLYLKKDNGTASIVTVNPGGGGSGDVVGPGSATDNAITRFDGVTGLLIQNSTATLDDSGVVSVSGANISGLTASSAVATDASKNLVSVANTGTGDNVLATSPTLITPDLGTPSALVGTNISGTAAAFTASNVTTNANLTGGVTSVGNAATVVTNANLTGGVTSVGNAATVVTNANLTGMVTSVGNAASLGSFTSAQLAAALTDETGSGVLVFGTSPTIDSPTFSGQVSVAQSTSLINNGINLNAAGNGYLRGTPNDGNSSTIANVQLMSWDGIGFSPSITGQTVPQGENAVWIGCRTGTIQARSTITAASFSGAGTGLTGTATGLTAGTATTANGVAAGVVAGKMIYDQFTATALQTTFTTSVTYISGKIEVYANGVKMVNADDVTVSSGTSVVFTTGVAINTRVDLVYPT